jgi:predicted nucleic acid-binding protein
VRFVDTSFWVAYRYRRDDHYAEAVGFLDAVEASPRLSIVEVDPATKAAALTWLRRHDERDYSFVDATSFEVMRRQRIREALAFDGDFAAAGFSELRP